MRLHHLSGPVLRSLNSVTEHEDAVTFLLDTEVSRRLLLLRMILDAGAEVPHGDASELTRAWQLLESAERADPASFRRALLEPQVGVWAATLVRRLSRPDPQAAAGEAPLRVELGFLAQLAAAVFVTAGVDFYARVPLWDGQVILPGLGRATVRGEGWSTAEVSARDGVVRVAAGGTTTTLPQDVESDAPGWEGLRKLRAEHAGVAVTVTLDDLGPGAPVPALRRAGRLSPARFVRWQDWFGRMWPELVEGHPDSARALAAGLLSVVPLARGERLRARAASSSDAFGCVLLSEPDADDDVLPAQLGVALVHELRHSLLNGLAFLTPLFEERGELFHTPWRDDPRPIGGLVHGAYAFSGVAHYWRTRGTDGLAGFEFALWRDAVRAVLETLLDHPALTPSGSALVTALYEQTSGWREDQVSPREQRLAHLAATHHQATWRVHHLHTPTAHARELTAAWCEGRRGVRGGTEPELRVDPHARRLDSLALLARLSLVAPAEFEALRQVDDPAHLLPGVARADVALMDGDAETAVKLYAEELTGPGGRQAAWAGLGLALAERGEAAAGAALVEHPELAVAVSRSLPTPPDPVALAHWLAG
ncbi:HEXXH motif domain-containing protein [Streptomyces sp. NBC_00289]|uniref:HEXXH motif domain-containing protein n=1 Tax=Streptomyces sp. NBC_00289 TaxID=2975703 RepID=UPI003252E452